MKKGRSLGHFEREAYVQWLVPGSILVAGLISVVVGAMCFSVIDAARVDACLDSGGSYDYESGECDLEQSHPGP